MKIPIQNPTSGGSLLTIFIVLLLAVTLVGTSVLFSNTQNRQAARQRETSETVAAADGALEYTYALWRNKIRGKGNRALKSDEVAALQAGVNTQTSQTSPGAELAATGKTLSNFNISVTDPWGAALPETKAYTVPADDFPGWSGQAFFYKASVMATGPRNNVRATVSRNFSLRSVPLFQAAIFYMGDLEIHPGALMTINGLVHSNKDIYASGYAKLQFLENVSFVGAFHEEAPQTGNWSGYASSSSPPPRPTVTPYWKDDLQTGSSTEKATQLYGPVDRIEPFGKRSEDLFSTTDTNQNNDGYHEWIEPPIVASGADADPPEIAGARLYNNADLRIQIDSSKSQGSGSRIKVTDGTGAAVNSTITNQVTAAISASTTMYDWREGGGVASGGVNNVTVTSLDMNALNTALTSLGSNFNGVVYVSDVAPQGATGSVGAKKAIRLKNGASLAKDLTVASVNPVYLQGDYNTGNVGSTHNPDDVPSNKDGNTNGTESPIVPGYEKKSAAVIADAVTILSNNWNDANADKTVGYRPATHTTVNAAIMGGDVPTNYNGNNKASGGAHNFPRFLEMWYKPNSDPNQAGTYIDLTYYGSMVQAYTSKTFDSPWQTGNVYVWPNRKWGFDKQFVDRPPPGSVGGVRTFRGRWERM